MSRCGPMLFTPHERAMMTKCASCGGDVEGGVLVLGRLVHRGSCEASAREDLAAQWRDIPDPPAFVYPDDL